MNFGKKFRYKVQIFKVDIEQKIIHTDKDLLTAEVCERDTDRYLIDRQGDVN